MDAQQPSTVFRDRPPLFAPAQLIALGLVAASIGWAVWLLRDRPSSEEVELLAGMALPSSEMAIMEAAFDRAQLTDHRTDGGRVWVPRSRQSAYMRALVDAEALPREFGGSLRRALEKNSPWQSRTVQTELIRVATQEELSLVICSMPGIERAAVLYDTENRSGLDAGIGGGPAKTASVNVRTQPDTELDPVRVQAIRVLVSASIAGLAPERVAVTDLRSGRVYAGPLDAAADRDAAAVATADPALARKIAHEQHLAAKVRQALAFVKGAAVDVSVEFAVPATTAAPVPPLPAEHNAPRPVEPLQPLAAANAPAEISQRPADTAPAALPVVPPPAPRSTAADGPESILVSIAVPDTYFQAAAGAALERAGQPALQPLALEQQEVERIRRHVLPLLPATRDPAPSARRGDELSIRAAGHGRPPGIADPRAERPTAAAQENDPSARGQLGRPEDIVAAVLAGRFADVPRPVWLAGMSVCIGLLAGFMWWAGGRRPAPYPTDATRRRDGQPRIDWSGIAESNADDERLVGHGTAGIGRAAVLLLAICCGGVSQAAGPEPLPAIAPLPESLPPEPPTSSDGIQPAAIQPAAAQAAAVPSMVRPATAQQATASATTDRPAAAGPPRAFQALPLDVRTDGRAGPAMADAGRSPGVTGMSGRLSDWKLLAVMVAALAAVAAATMLSKRRTATLPPDVFEVLGEASLGGQHAVRIVRFGPKTLLVGVSAAGCHALAELSDPQATACIAAACRGVHPPIRPQRAGMPQRSPAPVPQRAGGEAA